MPLNTHHGLLQMTIPLQTTKQSSHFWSHPSARWKLFQNKTHVQIASPRMHLFARVEQTSSSQNLEKTLHPVSTVVHKAIKFHYWCLISIQFSDPFYLVSKAKLYWFSCSVFGGFFLPSGVRKASESSKVESRTPGVSAIWPIISPWHLHITCCDWRGGGMHTRLSSLTKPQFTCLTESIVFQTLMSEVQQRSDK